MTSISSVVSVVSSCLLLVTITTGAPKYHQKYDKPGHLNKFPGIQYHYNKNYIPEEDIIADWNNPWNFNRDMRLPNFGPWMDREDGRVTTIKDAEDEDDGRVTTIKDREDGDEETVQKRSFQNMFRLFKKSLDSRSSNNDVEDEDDERVDNIKDREDADEEDADKETVQKRSFQKMFRLFKKSLDSRSSKTEKRNFVPMLG